ncbi:MAG: NUDIX domain-containing protein [Tetrasphaera sp.]
MSGHAPPAVRHLYDDALATLLAWRAPDPTQEHLRRSFLTVLGNDPSAVSKAGPPAHLTASCLVMSRDGERVLLHRHRKAGLWLQFGGHLEAEDAGLWEAAAREAREESGLDGLDPLPGPIDLDRHLLGARFGSCTEHLDVRYLALADAEEVPVASAESEEVAWWPAEDLPPGAGADLPRLIGVARHTLG